MSIEKILVTGNMGYVGPSLIKRLREAYPNSQIFGVDMGYFAHCLTGADFLPERYLSCQYFQDVRDIQVDLLENIDAVIHLAAVSNDPMGNVYEAVTTEVNFEASVQLAKLAKQAGVKSFVFASSCSVYGYAEGDAGAYDEGGGYADGGDYEDTTGAGYEAEGEAAGGGYDDFADTAS